MRLLFGESCSLRCDHILNSRFKEGNQIELPFADDRAVGINQRALGFVQSEKDAALAKERRLRRIDVFGRRRITGENSSGKSNDFANVIADGKHDTPTKAIVEFTLTAFLIAQLHQPAREQFLPAISFFAGPL